MVSGYGSNRKRAGGAAGRKATAVRCVKLLFLLTTVSTLGSVVSSVAFTAHRCLDHLEGVSPFKSPENTQTTCWESLLSTRVQVCSCSPEEIQLLHHYPEFSPPWHCGADRQARVKGLLPSCSVKDGSNAGFFCSDFPFWGLDTNMAVPVITNFHHNTCPQFGFCFKIHFFGRLLKKCEPWKVCHGPAPATFTNRQDS